MLHEYRDFTTHWVHTALELRWHCAWVVIQPDLPSALATALQKLDIGTCRRFVIRTHDVLAWDSTLTVPKLMMTY